MGTRRSVRASAFALIIAGCIDLKQPDALRSSADAGSTDVSTSVGAIDAAQDVSGRDLMVDGPPDGPPDGPSPCVASGRLPGWYVSPTGSAQGDGSWDRPWDLRTALAHPAAVKPGDTVWLRGGTYPGSFTSRLNGTVDKPIVVRGFPGERATIDGGSAGAWTLVVSGRWTWFWGFELTSSAIPRTAPTVGGYVARASGIQNVGPSTGTRLINLDLHDVSHLIEADTDADGWEIYGNLFHDYGFDDPQDSRGAGLSTKNRATNALKRIEENILFRSFSYGIFLYTTIPGTIDNHLLAGNIVFDISVLSRWSAAGALSIHIGAGGTVARNHEIVDNVTYTRPTFAARDRLGWSGGIAALTMRGNYFSGPTALELISMGPVTITDNVFHGRLVGFTAADFPSNTYHATRPTGGKAFVRPNRYDPERAHVAVFNWDRRDTIDLDVQGVLSPGDRYALRDVQNLAGPPVASGTYGGGPLVVPMGSASITPPGGQVPVSVTHTDKEFGAFLLLRGASACPL